MSRKRILSLLLSAAMLMMLLAGCGGHEEALLKVVDSFNASQDEYEVVAEQQPYSEFDAKLMQAVRNGTGPDMVTMFPSDAINYMEENLLVDLAPYINDPEIGVPNFKESMSAGMYEEITQWGEDSIYLFPITATGEVLFYNKTMFDKYGLEAPQTWTDVEEASKVIYENEGIPGFGTDSVTDTYQCLIRQAAILTQRPRRWTLTRPLAKRSCSGLPTACRRAISAWWGKTSTSPTPSAARLWRPTLVPARASAMCRRPLATPSSWAACPSRRKGL